MSFANDFQEEENFEELDRLREEAGLRFENLFPPGMLMSRKVYAALLGSDSLDWVENINVAGTHYKQSMDALHQAGLSISRRLGVPDDFDEDIIELREIYKRKEMQVACLMFKYGMRYQKMMDAQSVDEDPDRIP